MSTAAGPRDELEVEVFLSRRLGAPVEAVITLAAGAWSRAYAFRHDGRDLVVRFSGLDEDFRRDELAAGYASDRLPVPPIVEIGPAFGGFYAISERRFGQPLEAVDGPTMRALLPSVLDALDAMREADIAATSGYGRFDGDGRAPHATWRDALLDVAVDRPTLRHHGWRERLGDSPAAALAFDEALADLRGTAGDLPDRRHLVHSDLLNRNVLVAGGRISAILDWGSAMYGDFVYDVAWLTFWAPWYRAWAGIDFAGEAVRRLSAAGVDLDRFEQRLRACELHIALDGLSYLAFKGYREPLEWTAKRATEVARSPR